MFCIKLLPAIILPAFSFPAFSWIFAFKGIIKAPPIKPNKIAVKNIKKIVLLYEGEKSIDEIKELIKNSHLNALMRPSVIHKVEKIPVLGTGKVNFKGVKDLALQLDKQD